MVSEMRSITPSALGAYPIESVSTSSILFFADIDGDNVADRIRYFLDPATRSLRRGQVLATGQPPSYNLAQETFSTLVTDVLTSTSTPIFDYHIATYTGTSSPLTYPVNIQLIRLIKITINIEKDPNRGPELITITSLASLRNLKDNL
jgi:hypothetical protein